MTEEQNDLCYTLCPQPNCYRVPFIRIVESTCPTKVKIECDCLKEKDSKDNKPIKPVFMTIEDYIANQIDKRNKAQKGKCDICEEKNGEYYNIKENENLWYCEECKKKN